MYLHNWGSVFGYFIISTSSDTNEEDNYSFSMTFDKALEFVFPARYTAPLSRVAFWVPSYSGSFLRSDLTVSLYDFTAGRQLLETVSGGSGSFTTGRLEITGFQSTLTKGRLYSVLIRRSGNQSSGYINIYLGPKANINYLSNVSLLRSHITRIWDGNNFVGVHDRFNCQIIQDVGGTDRTDYPLLSIDSSNNKTSSHTGSMRVDVTIPDGVDYRFVGVSLGNFEVWPDEAARRFRINVFRGTEFVATTYPMDRSYFKNFGYLFRFCPSIRLVGGQTYSFSFVNPPTLVTRWIDGSFRPWWLSRFRLFVGNTEVIDKVPFQFLLLMSPYEPVLNTTSFVDPYMMMPVG